jgi:Uncharacterised nucleotidyltransferase
MHRDGTVRLMSDLWASVDRLIDSAPGLEQLRWHRIELLAARRWRELGRPIPADLIEEAHRVGLTAIMTPLFLEKVRAACEGPLVLIKGAEVAARYPEPTLRPSYDIDLLVPQAAAVQAALIAGGFQPVGPEEHYRDTHHLRPLSFPGMPLYIEVHSTPKWPAGLVPPSTEELVESAVPSSLDIDGILSLRPTHHTLVLAAHAWAHDPLGRLSYLIDVAAVAQGVDPVELNALARRWTLTELWKTTAATVDALLLERRQHTVPLRLWARHLRTARQQTVLEMHLTRLLSPFWGLPLPAALPSSAASLIGEFRRTPGESWGRKIKRAARALGDASIERSAHDRALDRDRLSAPTYLEQVQARQERPVGSASDPGGGG